MQPAEIPDALRKVAASSTKVVRLAAESEEEAIQTVMLIWKATISQVAHSLRVGKYISLMPLGSLRNEDLDGGMMPTLYLAEPFQDKYGVVGGDFGMVKPHGPLAKLAYSDIAAAVQVGDKAVIPAVLAAIIQAFGELCKTQALVRMDCSPLGQLICEDKHLDLVPRTSQASIRSTEPQRTVGAMMSRLGVHHSTKSAGPHCLVPGVHPHRPGEKGSSLNQARSSALCGSSSTSACSPARSAGLASTCTVAAMMGKRAEGMDGTLNPPVRRKLPQNALSVDPVEHSVHSIGGADPAQFVRSARAKLIDYPPLLDEFSRTLAAPYGEELYHGSHSARIAAHLSPHAADLVWDNEAKCLKWRRPRRLRMDGPIRPEPPHPDFLGRKFADMKILRGSPLDLELQEANISHGAFYAGYLRYLHYVTEGIEDSVIAPLSQTSVQNIGRLLDLDRFAADLSHDDISHVLGVVHEEMSADHLAASKRAITDYIFRDELSRERVCVSVVPAPVPDWGTTPFVGIEGMIGGLPAEWAAGIEENRDELVRILSVCNKSSLGLLGLWHTAGKADTLLVDLPEVSANLVDIECFLERQRIRCTEVVAGFRDQWLSQVHRLLREENSINLRRSARGPFFGSVSTLLSLQTRSCVSQSVGALVAFVERFTHPQPLTPQAAMELKDADDRQDAFLTIKLALAPRGDELELKDGPAKILEAMLKVFRDVVVSLNDLALSEQRVVDTPGKDRPAEAKPADTAAAEHPLWGTSVDEEYVQIAEEMIQRTVQRNMMNVSQSLRVYDEFAHLLTEEARIRDFVKDSSKTIEDYSAVFRRLKQTASSMRNKLPGEIRMQLASVDCWEMNELLTHKVDECIRVLLGHIAAVNHDRNEALCKSFDGFLAQMSKQPWSAAELVDFEAKLDEFRSTTVHELSDRFLDIKAWQQMLFECEFLLTPRDFTAITDSATWIRSIDAKLVECEDHLKTCRETIESRFKDDRAKFEADLASHVADVIKFKDCGNFKMTDEYIQNIKDLNLCFDRARYDAERFRERERLLGWDPSEFEKLNDGMEKLKPYEELWDLVYRFLGEEKRWMRGPLFHIEPDVVERTTSSMAKKCAKLQAAFEEKGCATPAGVAKKVKKDIDAFKPHLPLLHALCNKGLRPRHWDAISHVVEFELDHDKAITLKTVLDMDVGLAKHIEELEEISDAAAREYTLEQGLDTMEEQWGPVVFELMPWKDTETFIVSSTTVDEMQSLMDDHIIKVQTMKGSPYAGYFMGKIKEEEAWLVQTQEIMDTWISVQNAWLYLEPIFGAEDIVKQMPTEAGLFKAVDSTWRSIMESAKKASGAKDVTTTPGLLDMLQECQDHLETVQKGLNDYLESKRLAFPRFFFLSNDNLLEILSETKDPTKVNPHMKKAFEGIQSLEFTDDHKITAMFSPEQERVEVVRQIVPAEARGSVEKWLAQVEEVMLETVRHVVMASCEDYPARRFTEWLKMWPGQVVIAIFCLYWTQEVTLGLSSEGNRGVRKYGGKLDQQLAEIIEFVRDDIPKLVRCTLEALIVIFVHNKDTVFELARAGVDKDTDFEWLVQLRYGIETNPDKPEQSDLFVRITNSFLGYAYEYIGNSSRLVVTPLTDRCYRTCCGALHLLYGAAPEGPAGTGKTETVKDLSKALARFCVVFNCSDELNYLAMAKFFKGLAASGGWACFDEFNRIDAEVLSVIAQQILCIQIAIKERKRSFDFEGTTLPIIWTCNCFITMNPGYAGRAELPDNLKALFRTVAMMVPDYAMIAENKLYAYGYEDSRSLALKIVTTYTLCSEQLSSQKHYDYGMRAVFAVLVRAGSLKRQHPHTNESVLMLQSVNDVNVAKFLDFDVPLYQGICRDLFPGVDVPKPDYSVMVGKITEHLNASHCQAHPYFIEKVIQFYECHLVRHSVMLVGLPYCGKTTALNTLQQALTDLANDGTMHAGQKVHQARLNPKAILPKDLYGSFDEISHEWTDGIVAVLFREFARNQTEERKWLVFDGPVDAVWIENMNTVMDENKKLCLNSGEIIAMSANMRTIIEPMDVEVASPATISRNGMVYFEPQLMGHAHLVDKTQSGELPPQMTDGDKAEFRQMLDFLVPPLLNFFASARQVSPSQDQNMVQSLLTLLRTHLAIAFEQPEYKHATGDPKNIVAMIDAYALFSAIWSIGAACETSSRQSFGTFFRKLVAGEVESHKPFKKILPNFPERGSVFDFCFNLQATNWVVWASTVEPQVLPDSAPVQSIIVQTVDNIRYRYILNHCVKNQIKLLFCGPTGTGKTVYMQQALMDLSKDSYTQIFIGFSARTNCAQTQSLVDAKLERRRKFVYGPPVGKHCVVMVDDLNMPVKEQFGAQPPIEILRQGMDSIAYAPHGGWFDCKDSTHPFRNLLDVLFFASMGVPGGGRTFITPRLTAHFYLVGFPLLDDENMAQIFLTILDSKFKAGGYPPEVAGLCKQIVASTLAIYKCAAAELLPTPMKVHYLFNLRDFAKAIFGVLLLKSGECEGSDRHFRLWAHEILRVFGDRLIDDGDREWMLAQLRDQADKTFQVSFDELMCHLDSNSDGKVDTLGEIRTLVFGDMMSPVAVDNRPYAECSDVAALQRRTEGHLAEHNDTSNKPMDLVCFLYMLEHLSRVARVIKSPGGNALLVGVGGSGRQSCTRLAAFMADFDVFQIEIAKGYDMTYFREDMKKMLTKAGGNAERTVFLFADSQIKDEGFVEDINNLLNSGEIPNVFSPDERVQVCEMVRSAARDAGKAEDGTLTQLFSFFVERCRSNLAVVVCFSPVGDAWRTRIRQFPSLVNCCTIDWYTAWPSDALVAVATKFLGTIPDLDKPVRTGCVAMCQTFHSDSKVMARRFLSELKRVYYSTPTSFLELIHTFKKLLAEKRHVVSSLKSKYEVGLDKLTTTELSVERMKQDLIALQPQLVEKNKEVGEMMVVVNDETAKTEKVKEVVSADEAVASEAARKSSGIKEECEKDLDEAMPALNNALKALDTLSAKEISEIKAMKNPAAPVRVVLKAVCILRGVKPVRLRDDSGDMVDDYWPAAVKMISEMSFLQSLQTFDKENIPPGVIQKVAALTATEDFQPDRVERVSRAAWGLCMWCRAMETYDRVAKAVAPKQESLAEAEAELRAVMAKLNEKRANLQKVVDDLDALNEKLASLRREQEDLTCQVDDCRKKKERAEILIGSLGGEKIRWTQNAKDLSADYINLTGDVIVASGLIAYLGAFTPDFRDGAVAEWADAAKGKDIPGSDKFSLEKCLGEPVKVRAWVIAGLPNDSFSIENGIIVDKATRWPLCIDPQGQANRWIKRSGQPHHIVVAKFTDADYLKRLEGCVNFGHPMLIENILEETDPAIEPVLLRQTFKRGNTVMMKLGDAVIEYQKDFKLFLTTKLRNPHYLPEVAVKVTLLNFMITQVGLQDQLLNIVVEKERPDLAEEKARLVVEGAENKDQLEATENKILDVLSSSQGNILDDESAVQMLSASKKLSNEIAEKQMIAETTEVKTDEARLQYDPVAVKTAILFFCIADLASIDPMYQYSLPFFISLFKSAIDKSERDSEIDQRIRNLNDFFMEMLYRNICRSLFERHKLLFSLLLTMRIRITGGQISMSDYRFLLTGGLSLDDPPPKPADWIPDRLWSELHKLGKVDPVYLPLQTDFVENISAWKFVYDSMDPLFELRGSLSRPASVEDFSFFQHLLVLRCVRPDRVLPAAQLYVADQLGEKFVTPPAFDLAGSYADSSSVAPLIFILSPGADPYAALSAFAAEKGKEVRGLSLGQGQGPKAERMMSEGFVQGGWVLLQNCHLFSSWMPRLDKILEQLDPKQTSHDFRLWLTSYPSDKFPVAVLQNGVKITNEAPQGIRANLIGSYLMDPIGNSDEFFEQCAAPDPFKKLLYSLCFFHAVIQERRLFGPLGWNIPYEFTQNDLRISARQLKMLIDESPNHIPFKAINYLTGECNYGGRVTEGQDRRLLATLLNDYYNPQVLEDDCSLCPEHPEFTVPPPGSHASALESIRRIPLVVPPGVYGFHENANLTREQNETYAMMDSLLLTVGQSTGGGGTSSEDTIRQVADDIMARTPDPWDLATVQDRYPTMYEESMNTVLVQELTRFNRLITVIKTSLTEICKAIKGLLLMSEDLEQVFHSIFNGKTPAMWLANSYPSLKPLGGYTNDLVERLRFFQRWVDAGIPALFWLSGIYFTQAFTTGACQNFARKYTIPIDILAFDFQMPAEQEPDTRPENGVYTYGLFLEGCKWDWDKWELGESDPKMLYTPVPMIWIVPCKRAELRTFPCYNCPVYKVSTRKGVLSTTGHSTNFVMPVRLSSSSPEAHWVKRGVAMLTQLDV